MNKWTVIISDESLSKIESIKEGAGVEDNATIFNLAFTVLRWVVEEKAKGNDIVSADYEIGLGTPLHMDLLEGMGGKREG